MQPRRSFASATRLTHDFFFFNFVPVESFEIEAHVSKIDLMHVTDAESVVDTQYSMYLFML